MTNTNTNFLPTSHEDTTFTLGDGKTVVEIDPENPLHQMRMVHAMDCKSTLEQIEAQLKRIQVEATRNLENLANGSLGFDPTAPLAIELDKLQEKFFGQVDGLRKMDRAITRGA